METKDKNEQNISDIVNTSFSIRHKNTSLWLNIVSMIIATIALTLGGFFLPEFLSKNIFKSPKQIQYYCDSIPICDQILYLKKSIIELNFKIESSLYFKNDSIKKISFNSIELSQMKQSINNLRNELENLNKIILDNPEKAISIPLLNQKMEDQKNQQIKENQYLKDEIARVYDINKWIIGLVIGMLVSIIILNISNLIKNKKE
jgi:hypothetical protein